MPYLLEQFALDAERADMAGSIGQDAIKHLAFYRERNDVTEGTDEVMYCLASVAAHIAGPVVDHMHGEFVDPNICQDCGSDVRTTSICADAEERY